MKPKPKQKSNPNPNPKIKQKKRALPDSNLDSNASHTHPTSASVTTVATAATSGAVALSVPDLSMGKWQRVAVSVAIGIYLLVLIIGPLSNPIASQHLTTPAANFVGPVHRALFMGHGYRFFAPNPGDSHLVSYKVTRSDGTQVDGVFPDRKSMWPRLLYHRWFMLSETVFSEHAQTPTAEEFAKLNEQQKQRIQQLAARGKFELSNRLESQRANEEEAYAKTIKRIDRLVKSIGGYLLKKHDGQEIELSVATRTIPFPAEVRQGAQLDDESFLRVPDNAVIGRFVQSDFDDLREDQ